MNSDQWQWFSCKGKILIKIYTRRTLLVSSSTRITGRSCAQRHREQFDAFPVMNPLARTRLYTSVATASGVRDGTDRAVGVASVMLQVQCISLPKRFVPSVSKCPSVVCPALSARSFSLSPVLVLFQSARSTSLDLSRYRFARANASSGEKEGEAQPPVHSACTHTCT